MEAAADRACGRVRGGEQPRLSGAEVFGAGRVRRAAGRLMAGGGTLSGRWTRDVLANEAQRDRMRQAQQLGRLYPDWMIWLGKASGCFDAMHPRVPEIVQARTAVELVEKIRGWSWRMAGPEQLRERPRKLA